MIFFLLMAGDVFGQTKVLEKIEKVVWITEHYPPFSYVDGKDGRLKGLMVDILLEMWKRVGLKRTTGDILVYPWARGIRDLENNTNTCLFGMGISREREKKYKFVVSISPGFHGLIAKKTKGYSFNSMNEVNREFRGQKGVIGVVKDDFGETNFLELGGEPALLYQVSNGKQLVKMLARGRLEMMAYNEFAAITLMKKNRIDHNDFVISMASRRVVSGYAFNKKVDMDIIKELQKAMDDMLRDGVADRLLNKHLDRLALPRNK